MNTREFEKRSINPDINFVEYDTDIIGAITGQAELFCRFIPNIDATQWTEY